MKDAANHLKRVQKKVLRSVRKESMAIEKKTQKLNNKPIVSYAVQQ